LIGRSFVLPRRFTSPPAFHHSILGKSETSRYGCDTHVRFGPKADITPFYSITYLVCASDQGIGDRDTERLGCFEIYDELY